MPKEAKHSRKRSLDEMLSASYAKELSSACQAAELSRPNMRGLRSLLTP